MRISDLGLSLSKTPASQNDGDLTSAVFRPDEANVEKSDVGFDAYGVRDYLNLRDQVWGFQSALDANRVQPTQGITAMSPQNTVGSAANAVSLPTGLTPLLFQ